jgi:uncharacterized protein YjdB
MLMIPIFGLVISALLAGPAMAAPAAHDSAARTTALDDAQASKAALAAAIARQVATHPNATGRHICYAAYVQNIGWQTPVCDGVVAGTIGQSLRLEALDIVASGVGGACAAAHVQNIGWQNMVCVQDNQAMIVGTTGLGLRMEALTIDVNSEGVCAAAHVQNIGWQSTVCANAPQFATVGTTGQSLRMEAVELTV